MGLYQAKKGYNFYEAPVASPELYELTDKTKNISTRFPMRNRTVRVEEVPQWNDFRLQVMSLRWKSQAWEGRCPPRDTCKEQTAFQGWTQVEKALTKYLER